MQVAHPKFMMTSNQTHMSVGHLCQTANGDIYTSLCLLLTKHILLFLVESSAVSKRDPTLPEVLTLVYNISAQSLPPKKAQHFF